MTKSISDAMQEARWKANISARELGIRSGVSPNTILAWERGSSTPTVLNAEAVASVLGITIDEYIGVAKPNVKTKED